MGKVSAVKVTTIYSRGESLGQIPKEDWPDTIYRRKSFACDALTTNLSSAIDIIEDFEKHEAWKYSSYSSREDFYKYGLHIEAKDVPRILAGYKELVAKGERPTHWQQVVEPVRIPPTGKGRGWGSKKASKNNTMDCVKGGHKSSHQYVIGRLKRDHPDIAKRLANGEFSSVVAAATEAGMKWVRREHNPLTHLRYNWKKANRQQRLTFLKEIGARFN